MDGGGNGNPVTSGGIYTALGNKADKATTLSGYGIVDAYSTGNIDTLLMAKQDALSFDTTPTDRRTAYTREQFSHFAKFIYGSLGDLRT